MEAFQFPWNISPAPGDTVANFAFSIAVYFTYVASSLINGNVTSPTWIVAGPVLDINVGTASALAPSCIPESLDFSPSEYWFQLGRFLTAVGIVTFPTLRATGTPLLSTTRTTSAGPIISPDDPTTSTEPYLSWYSV